MLATELREAFGLTEDDKDYKQEKDEGWWKELPSQALKSSEIRREATAKWEVQITKETQVGEWSKTRSVIEQHHCRLGGQRKECVNTYLHLQAVKGYV